MVKGRKARGTEVKERKRDRRKGGIRDGGKGREEGRREAA